MYVIALTLWTESELVGGLLCFLIFYEENFLLEYFDIFAPDESISTWKKKITVLYDGTVAETEDKKTMLYLLPELEKMLGSCLVFHFRYRSVVG